MKKRLLSILLTACLLVGLLPTVALAATATNVSYLDASGKSQTCPSATEVTSNDTAWLAGWYVVNSDVGIGSRVYVDGEVHLILTDGCTLNVNGGIQVEDPNALTIYAQSTSESTMGKLIAYGRSVNAGIGSFDADIGVIGGSCGTVTINGGNVWAEGGASGEGIGGGSGGTITISGGIVKALGRLGTGGVGIGGSFQTTNTGNAVIYTSSIADTSDQNNWSGIFFLGSGVSAEGTRSGTVYGNPTLMSELTIPGGYTLTIPAGASLTIPARYALSIQAGTTLVNEGTLYSDGSTVIKERGTLTNNGAIYVDGNLSGTLTNNGALYYPLSLTGCKVDTTKTAAENLSTVNGKTYGKVGAEITLRATPSANQLVKNWSVSGTIGVPTVDRNYCTISSMPTNMVAVAAMFDTALTITKQPTGKAIDYGETTTLSVAVSPHSSLSDGLQSFQWYQDGSLVSMSGSSYTTPADLTAGEHTYTCTCTIRCDAFQSYTVTSDPATVTVNQAASTLTAAPTEKTDLVYNGDAQALVNPGTASGGTMQYSLDGEHWSDTIPTGKDAGTYTVSYKVAGDANHKDSTLASVSVTIAPKSIAGAALTLDTALTYNGSDQTQMVKEVTLDGVDITGSCDVSGNVQTNAGRHTLTVTAKSGSNYTGSVTQGFTISKKGITVDITPGGGTYGGTITPASADLSGVVVGDSVPVTLTYTGTANDSTAYNSTAAPTQAGSYTVTASISSANYKLTGQIIAEFVVGKASVSVPTIDSKTYTGSVLTANVPASERYIVTDNAGGTDAGDYDVTLTLTDANNYRWDGADAAAKTLTFTITKAAQGAPEAPTVRSKSWNNVTLEAVPDNENTGAKAQYSIDGGATWQDSPEFTGLSANTEYSFAARYAETDNYFASQASAELSVTTSAAPSRGGSSTPTYAPTVTQPENGTVTVSPKSPRKGDTVTITPKPEAGYTVEQILVTDKNGNAVEVTNNGDGTYSFTQPAGKMDINITFMEDNTMPNFFVDVPADAYYYDAVLWAAENGITGGVDDVHFAPNAPCTRAQTVTFLWRAAGSPEPKNLSGLSDVPADAYYAKAVAWALENGITTGTGNGMFSPDATCTRAQAMTFVYRSVQAQGGGMQGEWMFQNPFEDVNLENYYGEAVMWAVANGVTSGTSDTTFSPGSDCTRAQIMTFLYRFFVK